MEHETGTPEGQDVIGQGGQDTATGGRVRRTATVVTGVAIAVAASGAAWAASGTDGASAAPGAASPSASPSALPSASPEGGDTDRGGDRHGRWGGGLPHGPGLGGVLHGEAVVPDGEAYQQVAFQRGTVSAVGPTSLTVKSEDGFSRTYVLDDATVVDGTAGDTSTLATGDTVRVLADLDGATATATRVQERELGGPGVFGEGHGHGGGRGLHDDGTDGSTEGSSSALTGPGAVVHA